MKAIHRKQPNQATNKDERISTRENPAITEQPDISCESLARSSFTQGENDFAPRRANKLKEFFGLFSIHNKLPQTRGGGTSQHTELSLKESSAKNLSKNFKSEVNSDLKFENDNRYRAKNKSTIKNYIKFNRNIRLVGSFAVIMLMLIATGIVVPYYIKSAETEAAGESHFGDALLTFSSESLAASVTLSNLAAEGSFATSTAAQQAKFSISTTNYTGYTLAIQAAEDTVLSGTKGGSLTAIPQSVTTAQYTANNITNVNLNNTWGFLPNYYKSGSSIVANTDTYLPISTTDSTILDETTSANTEAKQYTISLGARADYTNTVDTFSNTFILQYIANPVNYAVTYDKNAGGDTVTNMPYENNTPKYVQAGHVEATSITLSNLVPVRANYTFLGWCSEATGTPVDNSDICAGTVYNDQAEGATPNLTFNLSQTEANETTLYAMWHQEFSINNVTTMQQWNTLTSAQKRAAIDTMVEGQSYEMVDNRDNTAYNVAKLADGNVWLQDNLQLDIAANKANITAANTNANDTTLGYLKNGGGSSPYTTKAAANTIASNWTDNGTYNRYTQAMYNTEYANYDASYGNGTHKSGYYYNYCAASAGSYCYNSSSGTGNASQDICPAGWQMPAGDTSTYSYQKLYEAYGSNAANFKNALHVGLSGYFNGGIDDQGSYGRFWASTYYSSNYMRDLYVRGSSVSPQDYYVRVNGYSVRCVLKSSDLDISITFDPNGADSGSATTLTLTSGSDTLPIPNGLDFIKNGYVGVSWNTAPDGSGTTYAASTHVTAGMNGLALYAQWSVGSWMQDMRIASKDTQCPSTANTTVYDKRDGKAYTVKQMDGYCVMTKNLAYIGGNNGTISAGNAVSANGTSFTMTSSTSSSYTSPYYYNSNNDNYGVYYNYCAASGKQQCISSSSAGSVATDSICPAGWKLPTSPSNTSWGGISISTIIRNSGDFKVYAGGYYNGGPVSVGSNGCWWSATPRAGYPYDSRYFLDYTGSAIDAQSSFRRDYLLSVRCVLSR